MKKYFIVLWAIVVSVASAQTGGNGKKPSQPVVGKVSGSPANPNLGKLEVGRDNQSSVNHTNPQKAARAMTNVGPASNLELSKNRHETGKIPDGSYGTNNTGQVYSPSNPNYPYDGDGKLAVDRAQVNFGKTKTANAK